MLADGFITIPIESQNLVIFRGYNPFIISFSFNYYIIFHTRNLVKGSLEPNSDVRSFKDTKRRRVQSSHISVKY